MRVRAPLPFPLLADTQDKTIGRRALRISGPVSAANYWEARTAPLNLTGRFVYIQVGTRAGGGKLCWANSDEDSCACVVLQVQVLVGYSGGRSILK